jgi:histidinol dehydrogenase
MGQKFTAIENVGVYVPGGLASYPSTVLMVAVPACVAGVKRLVLSSPPRRDGEMNPHVLSAAKVAGVDEVYCMGSAMMGDEITLSKLPPLTAKIIGTAPIAQVDVIKDNQYVYTAKPNKQEVTLTYLDNQPTQGTSYYYVRVMQTDGQMAWASPIWVTWKP